MILVFFQGRGDWFIYSGEGYKPAIHREASLYEAGYMKDGVKLPSLHVNYRYCSEYTGIFRLTDEDEELFNLSKDFEITKKSVEKLLPCQHPQSAFFKMVNKGDLSENDAEDCFFLIQKERKEKRTWEPVDYDLKIIKSSGTTKAIDPREEKTLLRIIGALHDYISGQFPGGDKHPSYKNQEELIKDIVDKYGYRGLAKRTLEDKLAKAKKSFTDDFN